MGYPFDDRVHGMTSKPTLKAKKAYYARVRRANYESSMRLEGFSVESPGTEPLVCRESVIKAYRKKADSGY